MHPILIKIGPITVYSYGFFIAAAFLLALIFTYYQAKKNGLSYKIVPDLGFYLILSGIIGSRILYILYKPKYFITNPLAMIQFWKGGLVFIGGALGATLFAWLYLHRKKEPFWKWADSFAPGIALGQGIGRIGCLMAGCCFGKKSDLPWAITFQNPESLAPLNIALHPTQAYHSLAGFITFIFLLSIKRHLKKSGQLFGLLLMCYSLLRFYIEFYRGDFREYWGALSVTQWLSLIVFIVGITIFIYRKKTQITDYQKI